MQNSKLSKEDQMKFNKNLWSKYKFYRKDFSMFGGEFEAELLVPAFE